MATIKPGDIVHLRDSNKYYIFQGTKFEINEYTGNYVHLVHLTDIGTGQSQNNADWMILEMLNYGGLEPSTHEEANRYAG